uniref:Uncharacterized protein n=1 Tax=Aureoumbra lagunensis TaxID=44058 RepID=A0A7S3NQ44_9STRA
MSTLGVIGLASRIVDDVEILVIMFRVYIRCSCRPSRRRVLKALVSTLGESRHFKKRSTNHRPLVALSSRLVMTETNEAEEDLFTSNSEQNQQMYHKEVHRDNENNFLYISEWNLARTFLEEVALFISWRNVTARCCECQPVPIRHSKRLFILGNSAWLLARIAITGIAQLGLPGPISFCLRYLLAHPLEIMVTRCVFQMNSLSSPSKEEPGMCFWRSWRGALIAGILDTHIGLGAAPRLRALLNKSISSRHLFTHFFVAFPNLPEAICNVLAARLLALLLFGSDVRHTRIKNRFQSYFESTSTPNRLHHPKRIDTPSATFAGKKRRGQSTQIPLAASGHHHYNFTSLSTQQDAISSTSFYYSGVDGRPHHHQGRDSLEDG